MAQTAVDWLYEQIMLPENYNSIRLGGKQKLIKLIEQAKAIEQRQHVESYDTGYINAQSDSIKYK